MRPQNASQNVTFSWAEPADVVTKTIHGCKGYPRVVPELLLTPFSSIWATKFLNLCRMCQARLAEIFVYGRPSLPPPYIESPRLNLL